MLSLKGLGFRDWVLGLRVQNLGSIVLRGAQLKFCHSIKGLSLTHSTTHACAHTYPRQLCRRADSIIHAVSSLNPKP